MNCVLRIAYWHIPYYILRIATPPWSVTYGVLRLTYSVFHMEFCYLRIQRGLGNYLEISSKIMSLEDRYNSD